MNSFPRFSASTPYSSSPRGKEIKWVYMLQMLVRGKQASCFAVLVVFDDEGMNFQRIIIPLN